MRELTYAAAAPALDLDELERVMGVVRAIGPVPLPAEILLSPKDMAKLMPEQDPPPVQVYDGIPIRVSEWLGEGQWVALDNRGRVVIINGQPVDPGPDIFKSMLMPGEWVLPDNGEAKQSLSWYGKPRDGA